MVDLKLRRKLSEQVRHLCSGSRSMKEYKKFRFDLFGPEVDFEEIELNDESKYDLSALFLSEEALILCRKLRKKRTRISKSKTAIIKQRISKICLFLYTDEELVYLLEDRLPSPPKYEYDYLLFLVSIALMIGFLSISMHFFYSLNYPFSIFSLIFGLTATFGIPALIAEHTLRIEQKLYAGWEEKYFYNYPFFSKESFEKIIKSSNPFGENKIS